MDDLVAYATSSVTEDVLESLNARGASDEQVRQLQVGYIAELSPDLKLPQEFMKWSHGGTKLKDVYVFPLTNILNEIRGLQFRQRERTQLGYMDYIDFKGEAVHFGLGYAAPYIWERRSMTTVEGNFDYFPIQRHDPTVVSTLTARVSDALHQWAQRVCDRMVLCFDADKTGRLGVEKFRKYHSRDYRQIVDVRFPEIPLGNGKMTKDPNEYWELKGDLEVQKILKDQGVING